MGSYNTLYSNLDRKKDLLEQLQQQLGVHYQFSDILDAKAWDVLKVTSATIALISSLQITLVSGDVAPVFWLFLGLVLLFYIAQVVFVLRVVRPMAWVVVPSLEKNTPLHFETFLDKYFIELGDDEWVQITDEQYVDTLIMDHIGKEDDDHPGTILEGAIQVAQRNNKEKSKDLRFAMGSLGFIVFGLIVMAIAAAA